jgi:hypothetical protein
MATGTEQLPLIRARGIELQQFGQHGRSRFVHGGANRHFHCFEIQAPSLLTLAENSLEQMFYFSANFLLEYFRRFFLTAMEPSAARGRS